jgi:hypothetical protein
VQAARAAIVILDQLLPQAVELAVYGIQQPQAVQAEVVAAAETHLQIVIDLE